MKEIELFALMHNNRLKINFGNDESGLLDEIRKEVFVPKQKLGVIRKWFNSFPETELTKKELDIIKSVVITPKESQWGIIYKILIYQPNLSPYEMKQWWNSISVKDKVLISFKLVEDDRINNDFKLYIMRKLLQSKTHYGVTIHKIDMSLYAGERGIWEKLFYDIIEVIDSKDDLSEVFIKHWKKSSFLSEFAKEKNITSLVLYEATKQNHYLPQNAQDMFVF